MQGGLTMRHSFIIPTVTLLSLASILSGCTTTDYTLYLQDVTVKGPIGQPLVHITNNNLERPLRITPHISFNTNASLGGRIDGHSPVDSTGTYRVYTTVDSSSHVVTFHESPGSNTQSFTGQNLVWKMPSASFGLDVDYTASRHVALSAGASYSTVDGDGLWGYNVGLGLYSESEFSAIRFDGGVKWQELLYEASTVVVRKESDGTTSSDQVGFFRDRGKSTPRDFFAAVTFNTKHADWLLNIFAQAALSKQSLAKFQPRIIEPLLLYPPIFSPAVIVHDQRAEFSSTFVIFTPGVYFDVDPTVRVLAGTRISVQTEINDSSPGTFVLPFFELEWMM